MLCWYKHKNVYDVLLCKYMTKKKKKKKKEKTPSSNFEATILLFTDFKDKLF